MDSNTQDAGQDPALSPEEETMGKFIQQIQGDVLF